jgi:hypothetical protein
MMIIKIKKKFWENFWTNLKIILAKQDKKD